MASGDLQIVRLPLEEPAQDRWRRLALVVGLTAMISVPGFFALAQDQEARRSASNAFWRIEGQPCAPLDADRYRDARRRTSVRDFGGVVFERHSGLMVCTHRAGAFGTGQRYPVCKFDAPDYLAVSAAGQERFYDLSRERAATVGVVNGQVRCVVARGFGR